ncbi:MAG TPA: hypothetical protein VK993_11995, partial [Chthoniobacterales bacterium]|nr:hypothetical protein [Chthoniobacterales bacterium]
MIDAPASKSFSPRRALPQRNRISPLVWMNAVCLDAPMVAVSWLWLFGESVDASMSTAAMAALFLTAWLIYLGDRLGDCASLDVRRATSCRQRFCLRHRRTWIVVIGAVAVTDAAVVATQLGSGVLM